MLVRKQRGITASRRPKLAKINTLPRGHEPLYYVQFVQRRIEVINYYINRLYDCRYSDISYIVGTFF